MQSKKQGHCYTSTSINYLIKEIQNQKKQYAIIE